MLLLAIGSRGDVQPMAVLAGALQRRGVQAAVVALREYESLVTDQGVDLIPVDAKLSDALDSTSGVLGRLVSATRPGQALLLDRWCRKMAGPIDNAIQGALRPGESVISGILTRDVATVLGRRHQMATMVFTGLLPTQHPESHFVYSYFRRSESYNRWGSKIAWRAASNVGRELGREMRRRYHLPRLSPAKLTAKADEHPIIVAASPLVVPTAPDWPAMAFQTGYLAPPETGFNPPEELVDWLDDEVVYVGFGSMTGGGGVDPLPHLVATARIADKRIVTIAPPGTKPGVISERVYAHGPTPHWWLFPRMAAIVHHGGSGTTHQALRAGVPSVVIPHAVDQPYHGWRTHALGVGPAPLSVRRLTPQRLARVIEDLTSDPSYRAKAADVGARMAAEDGVGQTVDRLLSLGFS